MELVFGGDVIPHGEVKKSARDYTQYPEGTPRPKRGAVPPESLNHGGWDVLFGPVADVLRAADVAVVNLETPVTDNPHAVTREMLFNAPSSMVHSLKAAGVDVVSTGNNHALDQNPAGIVETLRHLDTTDIGHTGTGASEDDAWQPIFREVGGVKLGFLSMTRHLNGYANPRKQDGPHVAFVPYSMKKEPSGISVDEALEKVRATAAQCEALIVMIHWGTEYAPAPDAEDVTLGRALVEAGAAAVIGTHPHVLQPLESYSAKAGRQALIAYSLGNLLANQARFYQYVPGQSGKDGDTRDSMLLRVSLVRRSAGGPVELGDVSVVPLWIENNAVGHRTHEPRHIQPVLLERELAGVTGQLMAVETRSAEVEAAQAKASEERTPLPEGRAFRALSHEERKALLARIHEEKKAHAERAKQARELRAEKASLEKRLALAKLRRERILRMVPSGVAVASVEPEKKAESVAAQAEP